MPGTRNPNAEEHPPSPLQRGNAVRSAISKQRVVCRVGANLSVRPFFVWCRQYPNANFVNGRKSTQITVFVIPNTVRNLAGEREEILRFALNDKLIVNCYAWYTVSERRGTSPQPPFKKGGKSEAKGGCYPFKGGMQCGQPSAFSIQPTTKQFNN